MALAVAAAAAAGYDPSQFNRYFEDNKNAPECKYKADFSPSLSTPTSLPPPPPPPPSSGKIYSPPTNPNDDISTSRQDSSTTSLLNIVDHDVSGTGVIGGSIPPGIEKNNHRLLCSTIINGPLSVHPTQSISLSTDNITLTNPNTTLLYHGGKTSSSVNTSEEKLKPG